MSSFEEAGGWTRAKAKGETIGERTASERASTMLSLLGIWSLGGHHTWQSRSFQILLITRPW